MPKQLELTGRRFGRLTAVDTAGEKRGHLYVWRCKCDCGAETTATANDLNTGRKKSCGCLRRESKSNITHGLSKSPEYRIWRGIIARCENPATISFPRYGGRGVRVAAEWRRDFMAFLRHIGPRPSSSHTIERIDANGDYAPGNVKWASVLDQANNKRNTRYVVYLGRRMALCDAVRAAGSVIHYEAAWGRIRIGWTVERAVETPRLHESGNARQVERKADMRRNAA